MGYRNSVNNLISKLIFNYSPRTIRINDSPKCLIPPNIMSVNSSSITAEAVLMLTTRLSKAEKRLRLLTSEISLIKTELGSIQGGSGTNIRQFSTSVSENDGPNTSTSNGIPTAKKSRRDNFIKEDDYVVVYTDGACENNGFCNAKAGVGVWFGPNHSLNISKPLGGVATNNRAEIHACIQAITAAHQNGVKKLKIKTDSQFVISSMTSWIHNWKKNNWKTANRTDVKNKGDLVMLDKVCQLLDVKWEHVRGHVGVVGNEEADKLAVAGAVHYKS